MLAANFAGFSAKTSVNGEAIDHSIEPDGPNSNNAMGYATSEVATQALECKIV